MDPSLVRLIGAAVIPAAMITACAVLLQGLWAEHRGIADRIRSCSSELRGAGIEPRRRRSLLAQLPLFQRRMKLITRAALCGTAAVACYVTLVLMLALHDLQRWRILFMLVFIGGAALLLVAVALLFFDLLLGTRTINIEVAEHDQEATQAPRTKRHDRRDSSRPTLS
jgi:hypothetical protein